MAALGAVPVPQLLKYLREHRRHWPVAKIARAAKLPRSVVHHALKGGNVQLRTLEAIVGALGCDLLVVVRPGQVNPLLTE